MLAAANAVAAMLPEPAEPLPDLAPAPTAGPGRVTVALYDTVAEDYAAYLPDTRAEAPLDLAMVDAFVAAATSAADAKVLDVQLLPESIREEMEDYGRAPARHSEPPSGSSSPHRGAPTEAELRALLAEHQGNVAAVGRILGKARMQIHRWVERYSIDLDEYRTAGGVPE